MGRIVMKNRLSEIEVERMLVSAFPPIQNDGGFQPHLTIDELIGLERYRHAVRCPDAETIAAYAEDALDLESALEIASHEFRCPVCRSDVKAVREFIEHQVPALFVHAPA